MRFQPFQQVETQGRRRGVVKTIEGRHATVIFPEGEEFIDVDDLVAVPETPLEALLAGQTGDVDAFGLRVRSLYLRHAYRFDPRSGLSNARVEPKLHQVFIAHRVTNKLQPRMVLADEVGLGKTIEAGLVLKELRAREMIQRVLIVCPASLQYQWQTELASKFNEHFEIMNAAAAKFLGQGKANPFTRRDNIITSLNFAQTEKRQEEIIAAEWDLVIFDEAHRVRRSLQGNKQNTTQAYRLADELKELVPGLLMLTATPMQLHPFELFSLVELVEPGLFRDYKDYDRRRQELPMLNELMRQLKQWSVLTDDEREAVIGQHQRLLGTAVSTPVNLESLSSSGAVEALMDRLVDQHPLAEVMVRNRKAEIGGFAGREAKRILVDLRPDEEQLYEDISEYLRYNYNLAVSEKQNAIGFLMVTYQKMLASSPFAVLQSFRRRIAKLEKLLGTLAAARKRQARPGESLDDILDSLESAEQLEDLAGDVPTIDEGLLEIEIGQLRGLVTRLEQIEGDSKLEQLLDALEALWDEHPDEKVVIFTTFRDTQAYLQKQIERHARLNGKPVKIARFNGTLNAEEKEEAIRRFRDDHHVLISTESGGEGRNLQFAHILVNYDLPWNPMKVEQRIGRLDRIGQKQTVFIYNLACAGTVEERVLSVLEHRIRLFHESVGSLDPILGELESEFAELVMRDRVRFADQFEDLAVDIERRAREAREHERVLADFVLDRASLRRDEANRLLGEDPLATSGDLEHFCRDLLERSGGTLMPHADGGQVITLSPRLSTRLRSKTSQVRGVFDPHEALALEDLEFLAFGKEISDHLVELPDKHEPVKASIRRVEGITGGPFLEVLYAVRAELSPPIGKVIRHLVDGSGKVISEEVRQVPECGEAASLDLPEWLPAAVEASRRQFQIEQEELRNEVRERHEERSVEAVRRAERISTYRQKRLNRMIEQQEQWIADARTSGSDRTKRILPAREGKLRKDRERLAGLTSELAEELAHIDSQQPEISGTIWAASVVIGT